MPLRELATGEHLDVRRGDVVACIPLYGGHEHFVRCLRSILAHTPTSVQILVADDQTPEPASHEFVRALDAEGVLRHEVTWMRGAENLGFVGNVNAAFAASAPADVIIVNSDVVVADGWFEGLRDAAHSDTTVATATPLTNHGTIVSVPVRNTPLPRLPDGVQLDDAAARVRRASLRLRPRLPVAIGHCLYVRREALDLVGAFDLVFAPGYGEEVDFSQRCLARGLQHVLADDVLVAHHGGGSFDALERRSEIQLAHEKIVRARYPYYADIVADAAGDTEGPLARALSVAAREMRGLRVTIDARALGPIATGTQVHILELIAALERTGEVRVRALLPDDVGDYALHALHELPGVQRISLAEAERAERDDIVHRPWQVQRLEDVELLAGLGERIIVTQQDLIGYRNPSYYPDATAWLAYRQLMREVAALSAMTLFFSGHARDDAVSEDLVDPERARVVHIGVDHQVVVAREEPRAPERMLGDRPFLLCLGADFRHKNRVFALELLHALRTRHGWAGRLVFAGPPVQFGSSSADEAAILAARPELADAVVDLGTVPEAEKEWLLRSCTAVLYPTTYEGFGLVPFEAAAAGVPCLFAAQTSLAELLPAEAALLVPWDADASADAVIGVLSDPARREAQVSVVREAGSPLRWDRTGPGLLQAYRDAALLPNPPAARVVAESLVADARYWGLRHGIGGTGLALVGPQGALLPEDAQRTLAALAKRPATRWLVVGPLTVVSRLRGLARAARKGSGTNGGPPASAGELPSGEDREQVRTSG
ncbi:glycosyltransferase [Paraconexibacter sp.]|uniref:glycosyltransferase n=1 Tax=Paraconexibacter sp. TaxID=2949640 RepID=UPI00356AA949